ncbi:hypothetical protein [Stutzerimonas nitrititolerans]|uniref:hypothetical protein n=1 Tax=Stutzerimonas nitrititolerans TaxID=2482751 RepID=UPI0028A8ABA5|nr:hypothetical protein [Stutzerimonas nitrititolerans]
MSEFFGAIQQQFKDRLTSPLSGAFAISWAIINYQFFIVIFSDSKPWVKIGFIKNNIFPDLEAVLLWGIGAPLGAALAYILIYPHPARWAMKYSLSQKRRAKEARNHAEKLMPMTREDIDAEILPLRSKISNLQAELDRKDASLDRAKQTKERDEDLLAQLAKKVELASTERKLAETTVVDLQSNFDAKEAELSATKSDLLDLQGLFASTSIQSDEEIAALKSKIASLESLLSAATEALEQEKNKNKKESVTRGALSASIAKANSLSEGLRLSAGSFNDSDALTRAHNAIMANRIPPLSAVEQARQILEHSQANEYSAKAIAEARRAFAASQLEEDN